MPNFDCVNETDLIDKTPNGEQAPKSGHVVKKRYLKEEGRQPDQQVFVKENNALFSQMEAAYGALYCLLLGEQAPRIRCVVNGKDEVIGTASYALPAFKEYRGLPERFQSVSEFDGFSKNVTGLASSLLAAYLMEEEDLHGGNFGLMKASDGKERWSKIDHDRSLWSSATHKHLGERLEHWGSASQKYPITMTDINKFPAIVDADPYYWPTKKRHIGRQTYAPQDLERFKSLSENREFTKEKWEFLLKTLLISEQEVRGAVETNMRGEYQALREQIISHFLARRETLMITLLASDEFRLYLLHLTLPSEKEKIVGVNKIKMGELNNIIAKGVAVARNIQSFLSTSNVSRNSTAESTRTSFEVVGDIEGTTQTNLLEKIKENNATKRKEAIAKECNPRPDEGTERTERTEETERAESSVTTTKSSDVDVVVSLATLRYVSLQGENKEISFRAKEIQYQEDILGPLYGAIERLKLLTIPLVGQLQIEFVKIQKQLEEKLKILLKENKSYSEIYESDVGRIARSIGQCFDREMYQLLNVVLKTNAEQAEQSAILQYTRDSIGKLKKALEKNPTLARKEVLICACVAGIQTAVYKQEKLSLTTVAQQGLPSQDFVVSQQKEKLEAVQKSYHAFTRVNCSERDMPIKSEAYLLMRDCLRSNNSETDKRRCKLFAERPAVKKSTIGKIAVAALLGVGAAAGFAALMILTGGGAGVAAVIGLIAAKSLLATSGAVGVGYATAKTTDVASTKAIEAKAVTTVGLFKEKVEPVPSREPEINQPSLSRRRAH